MFITFGFIEQNYKYNYNFRIEMLKNNVKKQLKENLVIYFL